MAQRIILNDRRQFIGAGVAALSLALVPYRAQARGLTGILGDASDRALSKLGEQDGFYRDLAVRIMLPGSKGRFARSLLKAGDKLGLTRNLSRSLNDAASLAANEAKPVFREAIGGLRLTDVPDIIRYKDGGTRYLASSAGGMLRDKVHPLIENALGQTGAFTQLDQLAQQNGLLGQFVALARLDRQSLSNSVTDQALRGIYRYIGNEEAGLRKGGRNIGELLGDIIR
jgi:hypothetical protein